VLISLAGLGSGFIVVYGLLTGKRLDGWTAIFLATTALTSLTGFLFPVEHLLPSHVVGIIPLVVLAIAILARATLFTYPTPGDGSTWSAPCWLFT
jgi:hypothetical protein